MAHQDLTKNGTSLSKNHSAPQPSSSVLAASLGLVNPIREIRVRLVPNAFQADYRRGSFGQYPERYLCTTRQWKGKWKWGRRGEFIQLLVSIGALIPKIGWAKRKPCLILAFTTQKSKEREFPPGANHRAYDESTKPLRNSSRTWAFPQISCLS